MSRPSSLGLRAPWSLALYVAQSHVGEKEESRNRSPFIRRVWEESRIGVWGFEHREPWCCAFVVYCLRKAQTADLRLVVPRGLTTPSVSQFDAAAERVAIKVRWQDARPGDVVSFLPHLSHIGIVEEVCASGLITIEGNTCPTGSREGTSVLRKQREGSLCGSVWALPVALIGGLS